jgi:hypothetical protein
MHPRRSIHITLQQSEQVCCACVLHRQGKKLDPTTNKRSKKVCCAGLICRFTVGFSDSSKLHCVRCNLSLCAKLASRSLESAYIWRKQCESAVIKVCTVDVMLTSWHYLRSFHCILSECSHCRPYGPVLRFPSNM